MIKIGASGLWQDGDVIHAFSAERIEKRWLQVICFPRGRDGKRPIHRSGHVQDKCGLCEAFDERASKYRFERVNRWEVLRTGPDGVQEILGPRPNERGERINVPLYLAKRLWYCRQPWVKGAGKRIYGPPERERWYDSEIGRMTAAGRDELWAIVEERTPYRRGLCVRWLRGTQDAQHHLLLPCADMSAKAVVEYEQQWIRDGETILNRVCYVPYWEVLSVAERGRVWDPRAERVLERVRSTLVIERKISKRALTEAA